MRTLGGILCAVLVASALATGACSSSNHNTDDTNNGSTVSTATTIAPTQTSVTVGANTTVTAVRPTTTGM
jgi:hypothetical protein